MKQKKIPIRKCMACCENKPKKELLRIVKNKEGQINVDLKGKMNGRGAYICKTDECLKLALKSKKIERTFEKKLEDDIIEEIKEVIKSEH